jgi:hypothetical protein
MIHPTGTARSVALGPDAPVAIRRGRIDPSMTDRPPLPRDARSVVDWLIDGARTEHTPQDVLAELCDRLVAGNRRLRRAARDRRRCRWGPKGRKWRTARPDVLLPPLGVGVVIGAHPITARLDRTGEPSSLEAIQFTADLAVGHSRRPWNKSACLGCAMPTRWRHRRSNRARFEGDYSSRYRRRRNLLPSDSVVRLCLLAAYNLRQGGDH